MTFLDAFLLGIVEGLTEFLPISSTGHMMITSKLLGIEEGEFVKSFEISIQVGAILAVMVLYWRTLVQDRAVAMRVAAAFVPTGILGFVMYKIVKEVFLKSIPLVLWSFAIGGVVLILFETLHGERKQAREGLRNISYWQAAVIGVFQALAMIPGVSRSAVTVIGGLTVGIQRKTAVEFAFLLAVPTMLAATAYDLYKTQQEGGAFEIEHWQLLAVGFVVSYVVAMLTVQFLLRFVKTHTFAPFGVYRILAALGFGWWLYWR
jgi:undecaprenyl-diphosphatase